MNEQVGWRGLLEHLKTEAPRYVQLLPQLPRLLHQALQPRPAAQHHALEALLLEQRRSNRWLRAIAWGGGGFALGMVAVLAAQRWG